LRAQSRYFYRSTPGFGGDPTRAPMNYSRNAKALVELREWGNAHLPTYGSLICYDLALHVMASVGHTTVSLKQVYMALPYSEAHLRKHLRRFEKDDWVLMKRHPEDARNRMIEPTQKMLDAYQQYFLLYLTVAANIVASND
jgi:hypothetical protein